jgi:hypothetical protein
MLDLVRLFVDRLGYFLVAMADADGEYAAEEIKELLAVGIVNEMVFGVIDNQRLIIVGGDARK